MAFSTYFSKQARKPTGLFGHVVMSIIFNRGNAYINEFVNELMSVQSHDHVLEIGFGTGKLIQKMAQRIIEGHIEGIDISSSMVSIAKRKNKNYIAAGKVNLTFPPKNWTHQLS
jgi:ubiquinone/menaquinone biosynthesis C-methylase UbiE